MHWLFNSHPLTALFIGVFLIAALYMMQTSPSVITKSVAAVIAIVAVVAALKWQFRRAGCCVLVKKSESYTASSSEPSAAACAACYIGCAKDTNYSTNCSGVCQGASACSKSFGMDAGATPECSSCLFQCMGNTTTASGQAAYPACITACVNQCTSGSSATSVPSSSASSRWMSGLRPDAASSIQGNLTKSSTPNPPAPSVPDHSGTLRPEEERKPSEGSSHQPTLMQDWRREEDELARWYDSAFFGRR